MYDSKLMDLLRLLSLKELKELKKFVESPVHNGNKAATALYEFIFNTAPQFRPKALEKESAFAFVFPNTPFNSTNMRRCMSDLFAICEEFIGWNEYQKNRKSHHLNLLTFYRKKKLDKHFDTSLRKLRKMEEDDNLLDEQNFYTNYYIEREISRQITARQDRTAEPNLQLISDNLDAFYLLNKLKISCSIVHYQTMLKTDYKLPLLNEILAHIAENDYSKWPIIEVYHYSLLSLLEDENEEHFQKLRDSLLKSIDAFSQKEQKEAFLFAHNYCIKRINQGDNAYLTELLNLYKIELEKGILLNDGYIAASAYKNIVTLGIKIEDFDWTEKFIETYTDNIEPSIRESVYTFNMARLYFAQKEYQKVIPFLHQNEYRELFVELNAKTIMLKTYYELREIEALLSLTDSFKTYLNRKKRLIYHQVSYNNFILYLRQLVRLQVADKSKLKQFREKVVDTKELTDKEWFLEKITELEK